MCIIRVGASRCVLFFGLLLLFIDIDFVLLPGSFDPLF